MSPTWERESDAYYELLARLQRLRARWLYAPAACAILPGTLGVAAHVSGYWAILGVLPDNTYFVGPLTIVLAFVLLAGPVVVLGIFAYALLRRPLVRAWLEEAAAKYQLSPEQLRERAASLL